jgi:hypothetical protein
LPLARPVSREAIASLASANGKMVDDDFKLLGLDERGQIGEVGAAGVYEQIAIANAMARGAQPRGRAGDP